MNAWVFLGVAVAGGAGAAVRMFLDGVLKSALGTRAPWATGIINLSGSLLLGFLAGLVAAHAVGPDTQAILGVGFLGGYTTFSTASVETYRLLQERRWTVALLYAVGMAVLASVAAALGLAAGASLG